jgi:hypothetical protein
LIDGPYDPYRFGPGDLIPAARMIDTDFPGINDFTGAFRWMQGMPADAIARHSVMVQGDDVDIVFNTYDSGAILPGPLNKAPLKGPFGGGFYHLTVGFTAFGSAFLGAEKNQWHSFVSVLTSAPAADRLHTRLKMSSRLPATEYLEQFISSNPSIQVLSARPFGDSAILLRVVDLGGEGGESTITLPGTREVWAVSRARSDGRAIDGGVLPSKGRLFVIQLTPAEVASVQVVLR